VCAAGAEPVPLSEQELVAPHNQEKEVQYRITMLEEVRGRGKGGMMEGG